VDEISNKARNLIGQEISTSMEAATHLALKLTVDVEAAGNEQPEEGGRGQSPSLAFRFAASRKTKNVNFLLASLEPCTARII